MIVVMVRGNLQNACQESKFLENFKNRIFFLFLKSTFTVSLHLPPCS